MYFIVDSSIFIDETVMARYIEYGKKRCKRLVIRISPNSDFQDILSQLNSIRFADCRLTSEQIIYAILELLNNSLRAHRERSHDLPIYLHFSADGDFLEIYLQDWGGGFDTSRLPYKLYEEVEKIDIHDERFESYRNNYHNKRFGLGLYLAKKTFHEFSLHFIDEDGLETDWETGKSAGTVITLRSYARKLPYVKEEEHGKPARL